MSKATIQSLEETEAAGLCDKPSKVRCSIESRIKAGVVRIEKTRIIGVDDKEYDL